MKFSIGDFVHEGGPLGPISKVVGFEDGKYIVKGEHSTGYLEEEYLYPCKKYVQLSLFGGIFNL